MGDQPKWPRWVCIGEERAIHGVDEDLDVSGGPLVRVWLQLGLDIHDERKVDC